jgi:hypothetical protein
VAKRLEWEKETKRIKLIKQGSRPLWKDLRNPTGSPAQNRAMAKRLRKISKKAEQTKALHTSSWKSAGSPKVKVLRRREGEGVLQEEKPQRAEQPTKRLRPN